MQPGSRVLDVTDCTDCDVLLLCTQFSVVLWKTKPSDISPIIPQHVSNYNSIYFDYILLEWFHFQN